MKRAIAIIIASIALLLFGCTTMKTDSEIIVLKGKTQLIIDDTNITAPTGYFLNGYEFVKADDHTMQLVLTLTDNKGYGEM